MRRHVYVGVFLGLFLVVSCSTGTRDVMVVADNQVQISEQIKKDLTYEEVQLLAAYAARTAPDLEAGLLPMGRTVGQMIEQERAYQLEASGGEPPVEETLTESSPPIPDPTADRAEDPVKKSPAPEREEARIQTAEHVAELPERETEPAPPPPPPKPVKAFLETGTPIKVRLVGAVSSKTNQTGDRFEATLEEDLVAGDHLLAPEGSLVSGRVTHAQKSGKVKGKAQLSITLDNVAVEGENFSLRCEELKFEAGDTKKRDAMRVGIGAGVGAVIGAIAGGGKGAAIGTAVGGGAGTGAVLLTSGKEVDFPSEQRFEFHLQDQVEMRILR